MLIRHAKVALVTLLGLIMCAFVISYKYYSYTISIRDFSGYRLSLINTTSDYIHRYSSRSVKNKSEISSTRPPSCCSTESNTKVSCRKVLPKAAIIGAPKCGTGALQKFLDVHPDIDIGPFKDPQTGVDRPANEFFTQYYDKGFEWYQDILPCLEPGHLSIDSAPWNIFNPRVPERMHRYNNTLKLLVILREPVARSVSEYLQASASKMDFNKSMSVDQYLLAALAEERANGARNAIRKSVYVKHLLIWLKYFKLEQFYIVDGDEFAKNPLRQLKEIERFLGVKPFLTSTMFHFSETKGFYCATANNKKKEKCLSKGKGRPHPQIEQALLNELKDYFKPYNEKLSKLIGQRFKWT